ncbi:hypothetical protein EJB05_48772, partial [Eragrostis curvula]
PSSGPPPSRLRRPRAPIEVCLLVSLVRGTSACLLSSLRSEGEMEASPPRGGTRPPSPPSETTLSSLPLEILEKVVSHLPVRDAVRSSAVSRAWRRIWESAPGLALKWGYDADPAVADAVLARCSGTVRAFSFDLRNGSFWLADGWVRLLADKGVQDLALHFSQGRGIEPHDMDASIFSCRELTCLRLSGCDIPAAPLGLAVFPNLTWLSLRGVGFPDNGVRDLEALISNCPLLQVLWLDELQFPEDDEDQDEVEECVIQAPNLRDLAIESELGYDFGWQIGELPSIEKVEINFNNYSHNRNFVQLLTPLARVRKLTLKMPWRESNMLEGLSCCFQNLKCLSLHTDFCTISGILSIICLLKNAPNLEELLFQIEYDELQHAELGVDFLNAQWAEGLFANLRSEACVHTDEWVRLLAGKGVQSLTLFFDEIGPGRHTIHPWIFSCVELTDLSLGHCRLPAAPSCFTGFPNLTALNFTWVGVPKHWEKHLEAIISSAPSLRSLELVNVWINGNDFDDWVIQAPNLQRLTIKSDSDYGWQLEELSSLQRATIDVDDYDIDRDFVQLLTCFTQVTHLEFHMPSTEGNALEGLTCCFQKLKSLTLQTNFRHTSIMLSTFSLLRSAPKLVELEIEIPQSYIQDEVDTVDIDFFNSLWTNDIFANLDIVTMKDVTCWSNEMNFIEFVLSKARLLSSFYIYRDDIFPHSKPPEEAVIKIAKYKRVSPKAMVFFRNMEVSTHNLLIIYSYVVYSLVLSSKP